MNQNVNYIKHHTNVNLKIIESELNSTHISLYNALFLIWNNCGFDSELSINRNDVMRLSKIGSANTYTKCLKELDKQGFLSYKPSYNPLIGSRINLYRFDKTTDNSSVKSSSKGCDNSTDNSSATLSKQLNIETIKLLNKYGSLVNSNLKTWITNELLKPKENNEINNNNYYNTCLKDSAWLEVTCMQKKHKPDTIKKYLETFKNHLIQTAEQKQNLREFKSHFTNWLNKQTIVEVVKKDWSNPYPEHRN